MSTKMDYSFWIPAICGFAFTVIGASLGLWSAVSSHNESLKDKAETARIAGEHKRLLEQNYDKSLRIIEELNQSSLKTKEIIDSTDEVLKSQKEAGMLLAQQVHASSEINKAIISSGHDVVTSINTATKNLDDNITGGDSYCRIEIVNSGKRLFKISAINNFKNKIPNVLIKVENYSAIEKCVIKNEGGVDRIDANCYYSNITTIGPTDYSVNTNYFLGGDQYIDLSGRHGKLTVQMITPKNQFYYQIIYQIISEYKATVIYRILKKIDGKYIQIESNDDHNDPLNPSRWDANFPLKPEMPITSS